ncbi:hypothetical protein A2567_03055 [Candidatus Azambacteria bacterium RIFOXYD1_FULL_42_11]|uniref:Uncharacterized protein n=1 Tax=Candidatus Azambacteria bacterium RIFOXYD1_FULL_42_11 TaxID=1797310 RepID=A0A1F5CJK1_9BACT|nr:MAG: hypothetical protein A2567_03055 [Candidatus Azambacteria bacterium RIFOXYD1_FULL_42_11]
MKTPVPQLRDGGLVPPFGGLLLVIVNFPNPTFSAEFEKIGDRTRPVAVADATLDDVYNVGDLGGIARYLHIQIPHRADSR